MYEQNKNTPSDGSTVERQDAIDINDFVFAATGARMRRLTVPDGEHWFVAADVATNLGYANTRQALVMHVAADCQTPLDGLARSVCGADASHKIAGHGLKKSMKMVNLRGLISLVNGCTKPECGPFKAWVSEVIATVQRDGSYTLEPSPVRPSPSGGTAYAMPQQVADAIVRLEERNIRADELMVTLQEENNSLLRQIGHSLQDIAQSLRHPAANRPHHPPPEVDASAAPRHLEGKEPGRHRRHPRRGGLPGPSPRARRGRLPPGGDRQPYGIAPGPRPRLPADAAEARLRTADGLHGGGGAGVRPAVAEPGETDRPEVANPSCGFGLSTYRTEA